MAHDKIYGICENKCLVETDTKANTDVVKNKVSTLESTVSTLSSSVGGFDSRITAVENEVNGALNCASVTASGKITGNGGIAGTTGTFSGAVTGASGTFSGAVTAEIFNGEIPSQFIGMCSTSNDITRAGVAYYSSATTSTIAASIVSMSIYGAPGTITMNRKFNYNSNSNVFLNSYIDNTTLTHTLYATTDTRISIKTPSKTFTASAGVGSTLTPSELKYIIENECEITITLSAYATGNKYVCIYCNQAHVYTVGLA